MVGGVLGWRGTRGEAERNTVPSDDVNPVFLQEYLDNDLVDHDRAETSVYGIQAGQGDCQCQNLAGNQT